MSVSSHLTPEPERRLWLILESARRGAEVGDLKIAFLAAAGVAQFLAGSGPLARLPAAAAVLAGLFAFAAPGGKPRPEDKPRTADNLVSVDDLSKYAHGELIARLDRYLGGGITATQYYEDIVGQIVVSARQAASKERWVRVLCVLVGLAQLGLLLQSRP